MQIPQEIIRQKRDGAVLSDHDIEAFVEGITQDRVCDAQIAALTMAICLQGLNAQEQAALTRAMTHSGDVIDWQQQDLDGPVVDKHSTGGVGDKVSLMLAPIVAACGAYVPMISGRGLGHTGGTLDKLDSIPGYNSTPDLASFQQITKAVGCSIIGQTTSLAPADKRIYAVRDISGTVESIPLITASILSKKLAAGLDRLVMDVKFGNGAFMAQQSQASELAANIIRVAAAAGMPTSALVTDMNQVLGQTVGHTLEIRECIDFLTGQQQDPRLLECTLSLAAEMLRLGDLAKDTEDGLRQARQALNSGAAAECFQRMVSAHGGPNDFVENPQAHQIAAPVQRPVFPRQAGVISAMSVRDIGNLVLSIGGGRVSVEQEIDHRVGLSQAQNIGQTVGPDQPIAIIHAATDDAADQAAQRLLDLVEIAPVDSELANATEAHSIVAEVQHASL
ncbi:MAG: thymidine phosphorylase [Xanthomonadales bacterium]|nr:thymidine phosphorylase [Xanthomonadales bacterium]